MKARIMHALIIDAISGSGSTFILQVKREIDFREGDPKSNVAVFELKIGIQTTPVMGKHLPQSVFDFEPTRPIWLRCG